MFVGSGQQLTCVKWQGLGAVSSSDRCADRGGVVINECVMSSNTVHLKARNVCFSETC